MSHPFRSILPAAALLVALAACGDSSGPTEPPPGGGCGSGVVTVGAGGQPTVSWTGSAADSFTVVRAIALNDVIWGVRAVVPDSLASPITVGTVPGNAEPITDSVSTLASGYSYRVWVYRKSGGNLCKDFAR